ncbi:MAG: HD domain-containing protein [Planctomycetes bacterium]|jgi:putative nucleotidyltransferase with HDIG domain|nr:HD domain-containing protein [Planctomycetota bacterium]
MTTAAPQQPEAPFDATIEATLLVDRLAACLVNCRIYELSHSRVQNALQELQRRLQDFARATSAGKILIGVAERIVFCQGKPLLGASIGAPRLVELLANWKAGGIEFEPPVELAALEQLLLALNSRPDAGADAERFNTALAERKVARVRLLPPYVDRQAAAGGAEAAAAQPELDSAVQIGLRFYQTVVDLLQTVTVSVCRGGRIDFAPVQTQAERMLHLLEQKDRQALGLLRQEQYDAFTFGHSLRVALLAMQFARSLTDDRDLLIRIGTAGLLHDVGKARVPFELLHATRPLDAEERNLMNKHSEFGAEILLDHHDADPLAVAAAFGHHRGPDGSGYPRTQHEHHVSLVTSIVKICDIYEALTAARPYKQPMSPIRAYRVMLAMGDRLDRKLLRRFVECNGVYPVGQLVELLDGRLAVVRCPTRDPLRPVVAIVEDVGNLDLECDDDVVMDLSDIECCSAHGILCDLTAEEARFRQTAQVASS